MRKELQELGSGRTYNKIILGYSSKSLKVYHGRIDWDVAKRFLHMIYLNGPIRKTPLAMKTGVNSSTCTKYVGWLIEVDWVTMNNSDEFNLTEAGLAVYKRIKWQDDV